MDGADGEAIRIGAGPGTAQPAMRVSPEEWQRALSQASAANGSKHGNPHASAGAGGKDASEGEGEGEGERDGNGEGVGIAINEDPAVAEAVAPPCQWRAMREAELVSQQCSRVVKQAFKQAYFDANLQCYSLF